ncbi:hypothetical protein [Bacteroides reticulotermitis]|uniref:Uncharacterized protein n=1 Tax=Bacteroides reticulotermitis JCM 10512 TaxID=1445607 RepID=W4UTT3_9BACE|nr:hypothetical protein [Bacteroides reticulotermitis]GAE84232.1 hypothetical protein JCM10512_2561 [Bacteroides reticulotermitis JCM 10512]
MEVSAGKKTVYLKIGQPTTRTISDPVSDAASIEFTSGKIVFLTGAGRVTKILTLGTISDPASDLYTVAEVAAGITLENLDDKTVKVAVVGHTALVIAVGDFWANITSELHALSQKSTSDVNLYGEGGLTKKTGGPSATTGNDIYEAEIVVAPTVARFEITDVKAKDNLISFDIDAVFVDNFYQKGDIVGAKNLLNDLKSPTSNPSDYTTDGTGAYATSWGGALYDADKVNVDASAGVVAPAVGKAWGYYTFAAPYVKNFDLGTTSGSEVPRLILRINGVTIDPALAITDPDLYAGLQSVYGDPSKIWFVTINGFNFDKAGTPTKVSSIVSGYVFSTVSGSLEIGESDLRPAPNTSLIDADIKVTPITWTKVGVTPIYN